MWSLVGYPREHQSTASRTLEANQQLSQSLRHHPEGHDATRSRRTVKDGLRDLRSVVTVPCRSSRLYRDAGNANAVMLSSVSGAARKPPPVEVMTTYCRPSRPRYVLGTACAAAPSLTVHNSRPFFASNARNRLSSVAPMKTSPLAVAIGPPFPGLPVRCFSGGRLSVTPRVTRQANSPGVDVHRRQLPPGWLLAHHIQIFIFESATARNTPVGTVAAASAAPASGCILGLPQPGPRSPGPDQARWCSRTGSRAQD